MKRFFTDLHIHSKFSRATSPRLTIPYMAGWGALKGIDVMGTGDVTHPAWRALLRDELVFDEASALYRLRDALAWSDLMPDYHAIRTEAGKALPVPPLFMLQGEISSIYKKDGKVRKVHNIVYLPDLDSADRFGNRLAMLGNVTSDGRPILGLDSRDLLEILLEIDERAVLIPAHIWTPWFSIFGSKSGFDTPEACFEDLTEHVFAFETGLSSNPAMNRLWSHIDNYALISNSDAHSAENLGREATSFFGTPSYDGIFTALRHAAGRLSAPLDSCHFDGTVEFFPEEGKYYLDGHRACSFVCDPDVSRKQANRCHVCGKALTLGVLHRVMALADREEALYARKASCYSVIPLAEILSECLGVGVKSRKVYTAYMRMLGHFGSELTILLDIPTSALCCFDERIGEAIARMRAGHVTTQAGYDGEYGRVYVFAKEK